MPVAGVLVPFVFLKKMASLVHDVELEKSDGSKVPGSSLAGVPLVAYYFSAHWFSLVEYDLICFCACVIFVVTLMYGSI